MKVLMESADIPERMDYIGSYEGHEGGTQLAGMNNLLSWGKGNTVPFEQACCQRSLKMPGDFTDRKIKLFNISISL